MTAVLVVLEARQRVDNLTAAIQLVVARLFSDDNVVCPSGLWGADPAEESAI